MTQWAATPGLDAYMNPKLKAEYDAYMNPKLKYRVETPQCGQRLEVYPPLGVGRGPANYYASATPVIPVVVCGPSNPPCGVRDLAYGRAFVGLSAEMATYGTNRTSAIMKGARPGC